jgi:hypothetical protein
MRITTLDDSEGTLSSWFARHALKAVKPDGTVNAPGRYAIKIKVIHAVISQSANVGGYEDEGWFRPANIEFSLSRSEQALKDVTMTFSQLDSFMR